MNAPLRPLKLPDDLGKTVEVFTGEPPVSRDLRVIVATCFGYGAKTKNGRDMIDLALADRPRIYDLSA